MERFFSDLFIQKKFHGGALDLIIISRHIASDIPQEKRKGDCDKRNRVMNITLLYTHCPFFNSTIKSRLCALQLVYLENHYNLQTLKRKEKKTKGIFKAVITHFSHSLGSQIRLKTESSHLPEVAWLRSLF